LADVGVILEILYALRPNWDYLVQAQALLPETDPWRQSLDEAVTYILDTLGDAEQRHTASIAGQLRARLENLQSSYAKRYMALHQDARLDR
jgi:hypothetical protein